MSQILLKAWYKGAWWLFFFWPLEQLYRLIFRVRKSFYSLFKLPNIHVPIVVVGNITVGGSGKTPAVIALASALMAQGLKVGVVSRGYKGLETRKVVAVSPQTDFLACGDECVLLARHIDCPVYACAKRIKAVRQLIADHNIDVIISDDGLQHHMPRAVEIVVVDARGGFGNGHCLPVGPLREPLTRLGRVGMLLLNEINLIGDEKPLSLPSPNYKMKLKTTRLVRLNDQKETNLTRWQRAHNKVHAVTGIAQPDNFFALLEKLGFDIIPHRFRDHHPFTRAELGFGDQLPIVMTEKDAVRCEDYEDMNIWFVRLEAQLEKKLVTQVLNRLNAN